MPVEDKSKRVKRLLGDSMTTHLSSGNPRQKRCQSSHREHRTPTPQRGQLQTGIKVLTGMSATNLALILAYLVNGEIAISFPYHNGSDRPISFPHPTPAGDKCLISCPSAFPHTNIIDKPARVFIQYVITVTPLPDCYPTLPTQQDACCIVCRFTYRNILARLVM